MFRNMNVWSWVISSLCYEGVFMLMYIFLNANSDLLFHMETSSAGEIDELSQ